MDIATYLKTKSEQIEKHLDELVPEKGDLPYNQLFRAARYALMSGGKRLRPILTLATAETLGGNANAALSAACALEMIHTYSLIHDDLPCMDDDDFRRGKPSLHKAFTEAHAVLTGDYLLTYAFEVIANDDLLQPEQKIALINILAKHSGAPGMIAGQVMDIEAEGQQIDLETLKHIHRHKTGAIISASIACGGIAAGASKAQMDSLRHFGDIIGLAFQIVDDVIDVTSSFQKHGKAVSSDVINQKSTYATLLGVEPAKQTAVSLLKQAENHLDTLNVDPSLLKGISHKLVHRQI